MTMMHAMNQFGLGLITGLLALATYQKLRASGAPLWPGGVYLGALAMVTLRGIFLVAAWGLDWPTPEIRVWVEAVLLWLALLSLSTYGVLRWRRRHQEPRL